MISNIQITVILIPDQIARLGALGEITASLGFTDAALV